MRESKEQRIIQILLILKNDHWLSICGREGHSLRYSLKEKMGLSTSTIQKILTYMHKKDLVYLRQIIGEYFWFISQNGIRWLDGRLGMLWLDKMME